MIVTSICGADTDRELLNEVHRRLSELESVYGSYHLISVSHNTIQTQVHMPVYSESDKIEDYIGWPGHKVQWTALITAEVETHGTDGNHAEAGSIIERPQGSGMVRSSDSG